MTTGGNPGTGTQYTVKTLDQLLTEFSDFVLAGALTPQSMRDVIGSLWANLPSLGTTWGIDFASGTTVLGGTFTTSGGAMHLAAGQGIWGYNSTTSADEALLTWVGAGQLTIGPTLTALNVIANNGNEGLVLGSSGAALWGEAVSLNANSGNIAGTGRAISLAATTGNVNISATSGSFQLSSGSGDSGVYANNHTLTLGGNALELTSTTTTITGATTIDSATTVNGALTVQGDITENGNFSTTGSVTSYGLALKGQGDNVGLLSATLSNALVAGNPTAWIPIIITTGSGTTTKYFPCW
jgi:hypothetical protein